MKLFNILAILITLSAVFSYFNHRFIRWPTTIGLMVIALLVSLGLIALGPLGLGLKEDARLMLDSIDFDETLLHGMLSFLLFAGALHVNLTDLARQKYIIGSLATVGVVGSTFIMGFTSWWVLGWLGIKLPFIYCLLFGALISPTDPIAVMGILKTAGVPESLETKITGESLFNDGVAVVVFLVISEIATGTQDVTAASVAGLFIKEAGGGLVFGLLIGAVAYWMLKSVENYQVEVLITLALVTGGYALANALHLSGPIAIVVAGLLIGNHGRMLAMSDEVRDHLDKFWELIDEILNAVLFVLIGGIFLLLAREIQWQLPVGFIIGLLGTATLLHLSRPETFASPIFYLLSGGTLFMGFFLITDHTTSPVNRLPMFLYGILAGVLLILIRGYSKHVDGIAYAVLLLNLCSPLMDIIKPKVKGAEDV